MLLFYWLNFANYAKDKVFNASNRLFLFSFLKNLKNFLEIRFPILISIAGSLDEDPNRFCAVRTEVNLGETNACFQPENRSPISHIA